MAGPPRVSPIDSTPSVTPDGGGTDDVFVGAGNAAQPDGRGLLRLRPHRGARSGAGTPRIPTASTGCRRRWRSGSSTGSTVGGRPVARPGGVRLQCRATAPLLPGWPFFTADSGFTTPALADLYGDGQTEIVEGGDSSPGLANGADLHQRAATSGSSAPGGNLICDHDTNQTVDSSPAVGNFLAGGQVGIAFGTGSYYPGASDSNTLFALRLPLQHRVADEPRRQHHRQPGHR